MTHPLLRLRALTRTYGSSDEGGGVRDIDLEVRPGEFVAIMGTSGAGKSTLLNVLGLLDSFEAGSYELFGEDVSKISDRRADVLRGEAISFVFQSSHVMPFETVERNAALGVGTRRLPRADLEDRLTQVLRAVGLDHRLGALGRELSGGERQRLALARAIVKTPQLLLADEPTGNLDDQNTVAIMELLSSLNRQGVTIILITHDREVASYAQRIITLRDGHIVELRELSTSAGRPRPEVALHSGGEGAPVREAPRNRLRPVLDAVNAITARFSRTLALAGSLGLAVAGLVAAVGIGATASDQVAERLTQSAFDEVHVNLPAGTSLDSALEQEVTVSELHNVRGTAIRTNLEPSDAATTSYPLAGTRIATFAGAALAVSGSWFDLVEATVAPTTAPALFDQVGNVAIVGRGALEDLGQGEPGEGRQVWVAGRPYDIVGVVEATGRLAYLADAVIVPVSSVPLGQSEILVRVTPGFPAAVAEAIPYALTPTSPGSTAVSTVADLRNLRRGVQTDLAALVAVIGGTLLLVAILSAATSMYLSVQGRVQEIALRRALGYSRREIALMFISEGVFLGIAGSFLGLALGLAGIVVASAIQSWTPSLPPITIALGFGCGVVAGALSAALPAIRAARVQPAEAIRA